MSSFLKAEAPKVAAQVVAAKSRVLGKADDVQAQVDKILAEIDLIGWSALAGNIEGVLQELALEGGIAALKQVAIDVTADPEKANIVSSDALDYAAKRSAEMVGMRRNMAGDLVPNPDAKWRIDEGTREMVRGNVEQALQQGWSNDKLASEVQKGYAFSDERASTIARTETQMAANKGAVNGYKASGVVDGKEWLTADDDEVSEDCQANEDAGVLGLNDAFPSGDDAPPAHPNCRCSIAPYINWDKDET